MTVLASAWTLARRPRTNGLPIRRKITKPRIGVTTMRSNQAIEDDGRRLPGIVPSATILMIFDEVQDRRDPRDRVHRYHLSILIVGSSASAAV
jgi:hypothetical protein